MADDSSISGKEPQQPVDSLTTQSAKFIHNSAAPFRAAPFLHQQFQQQPQQFQQPHKPTPVAPRRNDGASHNAGPSNVGYDISGDRAVVKCEQCRRTGHTKEECYELIGFPDGWRSARRAGHEGGRPAATAATHSAQMNREAKVELDVSSHEGADGAKLGVAYLGLNDDGPSPLINKSVGPNLSKPIHLDQNLCNLVGSNIQRTNFDQPIQLDQALCKLVGSNIQPTNFDQVFCKPTSQQNVIGMALYTSTGEKRKNNQWIFDCGATDTMSYDQSDFVGHSVPKKVSIQDANGGLSPVLGAGTINLSSSLQLKNCLYVPNLSCKLLSISHVTKELNCVVLMFPTFCLLQDLQSGRVIGRGTERGGLYYVDEVAQQGTAALAHGTVNRQQWLLHCRLGHPSIGYLQSLYPSIFPPNSQLNCETCILSKSHRQHFSSSYSRAENVFSFIHSDVWGPAPDSSNHGFKYFLLFVDDCSRMMWVYFLKHKSEVPSKFVEFFKLIHTQYKTHIQVLRSDNGGEYVNTTLRIFCKNNGIVHQTTCPHTPQQNGVAERKNRQLLEMSRALLIESHCPKYLWPEAIATSVYLVNRLPTKALGFVTPLNFVSNKVSIPSSLVLPPKVFGSSVFVHIPKSTRTKLDPCSLKCVFVGYEVHQKGYRCYHPGTQRVYTSMDCDFLKTEYFFTQSSGQGANKQDPLGWVPHSWPDIVLTEQVGGTTEPTPTAPTHPQTPVPQTNQTEDPEVYQYDSINNYLNQIEIDSAGQVDGESEADRTDSTGQADGEPEADRIQTQGEEQDTVHENRYVLPPRANRGVPPKRYEPEHVGRTPKYPIADVAKGNLSKQARAYAASIYSTRIPTKVEEALTEEKWVRAMETEMEALEKNRTWEKCTLPKGKKVVGCRWVFTIKHRADGSVERYKARLVAKGYTQTYGIDYSETFSPVAKIDMIRVLFSIAANRDWKLHQFDVKNAFLHGDLKEEVYMEPPPGFTGNFGNREVCRLQKALYGLKQSPRAWFGRFTAAMKTYGYSQSNSDHTLFLKRRDGLSVDKIMQLGMGSALETLCGQAFGAGQIRMLGIYMQRSWVILLVTSCFLLPIYIFAPPILTFFGESEEISQAAGIFALWMIPQMFAYAMNFPIQKFLQSQRKLMAMAWISFIVLVLHIFFSWLLILKLEWGLVGAAVTLNTSWWLIVVLQLVYIFYTKSDGAWSGFSWLAFEDLYSFVKLSLASAVMLCLEFWYLMVIVVIAGHLDNPVIPVDAISICMNINGWDAMISIGFNAAISVRVANELGAGNARAAKFSVVVVSITTILIGIVCTAAVLATKDVFPYLFTNSEAVAKETTRLSVLLALTVMLNGLQPVLSGVAVGAGWQAVVAWVNIGSYYIVGLPLGILLGFVFDFGAEGIWGGMIGGIVLQTLILIGIVSSRNWDKEAHEAENRVKRWGGEIDSQ